MSINQSQNSFRPKLDRYKFIVQLLNFVRIISLKKYNEAIKSFDEAIEIHPQSYQAYHEKGILEKYHRQCFILLYLNNFKQFVLNNMLKQLNNTMKLQKLILSFIKHFMIKAIRYYFKNQDEQIEILERYDEAIKSFDEAIKINPKDGDIFYKKGNCLTFYSLQRYDEAVKCYGEAIRLKPNDYDSYCNKGISLQYIIQFNQLFNLNKYKEAIYNFDQAIKLNPISKCAYNNKGYALYINFKQLIIQRLGKYQEALQCFDQAISLNKNDYLPFKNKGDVLQLKYILIIILLKLGKNQDAIRNYTLAINKGYPDRQDLSNIIAQIKI